jgi:hypothetical protein
LKIGPEEGNSQLAFTTEMAVHPNYSSNNFNNSSSNRQNFSSASTVAAADAVVFAGRPLPPNWEISYTENGEKYFIELAKNKNENKISFILIS